MADEEAEQELEGIEVETSELEGGGVEIQIRFERAIELSVDADRYTFKRLDDLASWIKGVVVNDAEGLDREPGSGDLERDPGTEPRATEAEDG